MNRQYMINKINRDNDFLRRSFNELAKETFDLDFEDWYQNGYWNDNYIPYSVIDTDRVIANASVNIMDFDYQGENKKYIQIGTVMTNRAYRNQGLSKMLIKKIIKDYNRTVDGIFLFANDSVIDFYPKFGFRKALEYQYSKNVYNSKGEYAVRIPMNCKSDWILLETAIKNSVSNSAFEMNHNVGLIMFYITKFMRENVFFIENQNAYVIAEINVEHLNIFNIFSSDNCDFNQIIEAFGNTIKTVTLGFTPLEKDGLIMSEVHEENTTLFLLGKDFDDFEQRKIMFPILGHA